MTVCNVVVFNSVQIEQEELDHEAKMREAARKIREAQMDVRKVACPTHCCLCSSGTKWHSHCLSPLLSGNIWSVGLILLQIDLAFVYNSLIYVREGCVWVSLNHCFCLVVCSDFVQKNFFRTTPPFQSKSGNVMHHYEPEHPAERLAC